MKYCFLQHQTLLPSPAMKETLLLFLGWEDPLEKEQLSTPVFLDFPGGSDSKEFACNVADLGSIAGLGSPLEEDMATHSSILAWRIPWTEQPGGLQASSLSRI